MTERWQTNAAVLHQDRKAPNRDLKLQNKPGRKLKRPDELKPLLGNLLNHVICDARIPNTSVYLSSEFKVRTRS